MKSIRNILIIIITTLSLQSCFVVGAAAGAAGIAAVYDHRKIEKVMDDQKIAQKIFDKFNSAPELRRNTHINVTCFNHVVLLTGEAIAPNYRQQAEMIAASVPGVAKIYNQIAIQGPSSSLTRTSDAWITTKIKTEMLATKDLASGSIKVVTENGSVYLMGMVTREQADIAANIARQVAGVQRVMKIFQYKD